MTRTATAALAAHVFFELGAGVGMPGASVLGPVPAAGLWAAGTTGIWRAAGSRGTGGDAFFGVWNGIGLAAVVAHFAGWPRERTRTGLPWLRDCEGLGSELMPVYNTILYVSAVATLAALAGENRTASRAGPLVALSLFPLLIAVQRAEHRRLVDRAHRRPAWWNRRLSGR
jgi:hypothetical protein